MWNRSRANRSALYRRSVNAAPNCRITLLLYSVSPANKFQFLRACALPLETATNVPTGGEWEGREYSQQPASSCTDASN